MRVLPLVLLLVVADARAQTPRFAGVFALPGVLCDCNPFDFVFRTTRPISGFEWPDPSSRVVRTVAAGRLIEGNDWNEALTVVLTPSIAVALIDTTLRNVQSYGTQRALVDMEPGTDVAELKIRRGMRIEYLAAVEGYSYYRHGGVVYGGEFPFYASAFRTDREWPEHAVWFHLVPRSGRPAAWVRLEMEEEVPGQNVTVLCETHGGCVR